MLKVDNREPVRRLALRQLRNSKRMNVVIVLSIILTCIMFTALVVIGGSLVNGFQQETMRQVGGNRMAGLKYVLPEDYEKVKNDPAVRDVVCRSIVGFAENEEFKNISVEVNCAGPVPAGDADAGRNTVSGTAVAGTDTENQQSVGLPGEQMLETTDMAAAEAEAASMFCKPTTGRMPMAADEIAVSTLVLDELGLSYELGIPVPITLNVNGSISEHVFTLCGYWKGEKLAMAQECWVSRTFADAAAPTPSVSFYEQDYAPYGGYLAVDFNFANRWNIEQQMEKLMARLYPDGENVPNIGINWAYTTSYVDPGTMAGILVLLLVIFLAGYLIIYNIFHINVSANIRSYGLLKTVGTTSAQLKRMVRLQAAVYSAAGIPAGLLLGVFLGKGLLGTVLRIIVVESEAAYTVSARMIVLSCLLAAAFTFATVLISCRKPCRMAALVSPIEALRYSETDIPARKEKRTAGSVTPFSIASGNMARSRKKTVVVVLSLTLSLVLLNCLFTVLNSMDLDKYISHITIGDFVVRQPETGGAAAYDFRAVTPEQLAWLGGIEGVKELDATYYERGNMKLSGAALERMEAFLEKYAETDQRGAFEEAAEGYVHADIYGIDADLLDELEILSGKVDPQEFAAGGYAVVYTRYVRTEEGDEALDDLYKPGDPVTIELTDGTSKTYEVMAVGVMPGALNTSRVSAFHGELMLPHSEYFALTDNRNPMNVMIRAEDGMYDAVAEQIGYMTGASDNCIVKGREDYVAEYKDLANMFRLIGGALCGILALIGILNFVNAVATGVLSRRREFAMMSAVGMTGRQMEAILMWEGAFYAVLAAVCSAALGAAVSALVLRRIMGGIIIFSYHFTILPVLACSLILAALSIVIPTAAYRAICRESVVERLRTAE